jgi:hypothetical protein
MVAHDVNMSDHIKKNYYMCESNQPWKSAVVLRLCCIKSKDGAAEIAKWLSSRIGHTCMVNTFV